MRFKEIVKNWVITPTGIKRLDKLIPLYIRLLIDWNQFNKLSQDNKAKFRDIYPQLWDKTKTTSFDAHYLYQALWATEKILSLKSNIHLDIGSQIQFATTLGIIKPTIYLDFRPIRVTNNNFLSSAGNILNLPFKNNSIESLSCLHVIEHIGLGRYGDGVNPNGHIHGINEIIRVLAINGNLLISTPIGKKRVCFNAHRIFNPFDFVSFFPKFQLLEFSYVDDQGTYHEYASLQDATDQQYACGMFWLKKQSG